VAADLVQVDPDEVLLVPLCALCDLGHVPSFFRVDVVQTFGPGVRRRVAAEDGQLRYNDLGFRRVPPIDYGFRR
jgi:hypothetical protein